MTTSTTENEQTAQVTAAAADEPEPPTKAHVGARKGRVAPAKGKSAKKTTPAKKAAKAPKKSKSPKAEGAREGSKTAKVLNLLQRPGGATLKELMKATGWQPHSVRGFISGTLGKKMGLKVESTKHEEGDRSYSVKA